MKLEDSLKRVGVTIVRQDPAAGGGAVLFLRVADQEKWTSVLQGFLPTAEKNRNAGWQADVSKNFFSRDGVVRYLWRVVLSGDAEAAALALGKAALAAARSTTEIMEVQLVGRKEYEFDPERGKIKGAHDMAAAPGILASAIGRPST